MADSPSIRPFRIEVFDADLADLADRLAGSRWTDLTGVGTGAVRRVAEPGTAKCCSTGEPGTTGGTGRRGSTGSRSSPPTSADRTSTSRTYPGPGLTRSPLILTHGRPGSVVDFLNIIDRPTRGRTAG